MMNALKSRAPKYRLGYCAGVRPDRDLGADTPSSLDTGADGSEDLYTLAAMFGAAAGAALTAAIITEAVGCVVLLIPNRIREIKEEMRAEPRAEGR